MIDCLDGLVGLSDIDCDCDQIEDRPDNWNESKSGLYLTDFENGITFSQAQLAAPNCWSGGSAWLLMQKSLEKAKESFCRDLSKILYSSYDQRLGQYAGSVGKPKATACIPVSDDFAGFWVQPHSKTKGAVWCIEELCLGLDCSAPVPLFVFSSENPSTPITQILINGGAGQFGSTVLEKPILLPMQSEGYCEDFRYYFMFQIPTLDGIKIEVMNNELICGCSGKKEGEEWKRFMTGHGFTTNVSDAVPPKTTDKKAYGLIVKGFMQCNAMDWVCDLKHKHVSNATGTYSFLDTIAKTIQARAILAMIPKIKSSKKISIANLTGAEELAALYKMNNAIYQTNLHWIADNLPMNLQDCFTCKSQKIGSRQSILV